MSVRAAPGPRNGWRDLLLQLMLLVGAAVPFTVLSAEGELGEFPALTGRVVDRADLLAPESRAQLTDELADHEAATGQQVVVVTLPSLDGRAIEEYAYQLGRHWGIGRKEYDDGVLLLIAAAERQIRIEVGYGLEGTLTDAAAWDIIQSHIVPWFRKGDYDAGILAGAHAILAVLTGNAASPPPDPDQSQSQRELPGALVFWIFILIIFVNAFGGGRRRRLARAGLPGVILGGPRSGGGGFGGGFGGRGGSFGGGGASGGW
jgi:uncharacterized protein